MYGCELAALAPAGKDSPDELLTTPLEKDDAMEETLVRRLCNINETETYKFRFHVEF